MMPRCFYPIHMKSKNQKIQIQLEQSQSVLELSSQMLTEAAVLPLTNRGRRLC